MELFKSIVNKFKTKEIEVSKDISLETKLQEYNQGIYLGLQTYRVYLKSNKSVELKEFILKEYFNMKNKNSSNSFQRGYYKSIKDHMITMSDEVLFNTEDEIELKLPFVVDSDKVFNEVSNKTNLRSLK